MNRAEESDPIVVAIRTNAGGMRREKPTNKAGRPVAEPVERRVGTKGNAGQHSTRRAQNRESVTQALDRVRQAARTRKKERFTALLHHINVDTLKTVGFRLLSRPALGEPSMIWNQRRVCYVPMSALRRDNSSLVAGDSHQRVANLI